jgi:hypothetical protein
VVPASTDFRMAAPLPIGGEEERTTRERKRTIRKDGRTMRRKS